MEGIVFITVASFTATVDFVFAVASVMHKEKLTRCLLIPLFCCWQNTTVRPFFKARKFQIRTLKVTMAIPVHQYETCLVLIAVPELNTCTIKPIEMTMIVLGHRATSTVLIAKLHLTSWVRHKLHRGHLEILRVKVKWIGLPLLAPLYVFGCSCHL